MTDTRPQQAAIREHALKIARKYLEDVEEINITERLRDKWEGFSILESLVEYASTLATPARVVSGEMVERAFNAIRWMRIATYPQEELRAALEAALSRPAGDSGDDPGVAWFDAAITDNAAYWKEMHRAANKRAEGLQKVRDAAQKVCDAISFRIDDPRCELHCKLADALAATQDDTALNPGQDSGQ